MGGHEVDVFRRDMGRRHEEIALVFPVFIVDDDDNLTASDGLDGLGNRIQHTHGAKVVEGPPGAG